MAGKVYVLMAEKEIDVFAKETFLKSALKDSEKVNLLDGSLIKASNMISNIQKDLLKISLEKQEQFEQLTAPETLNTLRQSWQNTEGAKVINDYNHVRYNPKRNRIKDVPLDYGIEDIENLKNNLFKKSKALAITTSLLAA